LEEEVRRASQLVLAPLLVPPLVRPPLVRPPLALPPLALPLRASRELEGRVAPPMQTNSP
jgi:hypothetical protein